MTDVDWTPSGWRKTQRVFPTEEGDVITFINTFLPSIILHFTDNQYHKRKFI
jgi:hypothetical protein